ncbi:MAG: MFS transporter [Lentisphaeria bacterium]|nr:MFS transporter [Lentisphaeria bacterium]
MPTLAESSNAGQRKGFRIRAYAAACSGSFADLLLENSAIILLYFTMLDAGVSTIMFTTSISGIVGMCLMIPTAGIVDKFGPKKIVNFGCSLSCFGYLFTACAPFFGAFAHHAALLGVLLICIPKPLWSAAWYPILSQILLPEERGNFLGFMRFSYNIIIGCVFFLIGVFMGEKPPILLLQTIVAIVGIMMLGRSYFINTIPLPPHVPQKYDLKKALSISIKNGPLIGFAVYVCFVQCAFAPVLPMTLIYLKSAIGLPDNTVQQISSLGFVGSICAFFLYGRMVKRFGIRNLELAVHLMFILIPLALAFCRGFVHCEYIIAGLFLAGYFAASIFACACSQEILSLARPGNITMANAFSTTYSQIGGAAGRSSASFFLGCGALANTWTFCGLPFSNFQTVFLFCSGFALFALVLIFCLPSLIPHHEDYYAP